MDFKQAGEKFAYLKAGFEAGIFSESEFKSKLEDLMVRDEQGQWWMIGYETERWYRYDGTNWVQADPPSSASPAAAPVMAPPPSAKTARVQEPIQAPSPAPVTTTPGAPSLKGSAAANPLPRSAPAGNEQKKQPSWWAVLGITLAWYLSVQLTEPLYAGLIGNLLAAAIGGLLTGLVLQWAGLLRSRMSLLWMTLASLPAGLIANTLYISWGLASLLAGAIAGLLSALVLRSEGLRLNALAMFGIIASAALGWWVAWMGYSISGYWTLGGAVGGLVAGLVLVWALRGVSRQAMRI
jgi:hypothetical protein